jgi:hypothetical protein
MKLWPVAVFVSILLVGCSQEPPTKVVESGGIQTGKSPLEGQKAKPEEKGFQLDKKELTEAELGVKYYPGSIPTTMKGGTMETDTKSSMAAWRATQDTPMQVMGFYKQQFPGATTNESNMMGTLSTKLEDGREVSIAVTREGETIIQITVSKPKAP